MATFSKLVLSGSTTGKAIKVTGTATGSSVTVHTSHATALDEINLWAMNTDTTDRKLTIEWGGTASPDDLIEITIPAEGGIVPIVPGLILTNSLVVKAWAATANVVTILGYVNRIT
jgi:hypothetical protein